jgi:transposase
MLNDASGFEKIFIACGYSDLRRGIDGLANLIQQEFKLNPFDRRVLFLFCGRKTDRIKGLLWEGDGFLLLYKRLETGKFQWPRNEEEVKAISPQQYKWLMEGLSMEQKKAIKSLSPAMVL